MSDIPSKFQKDPLITFRVILLTHRQTNEQTNRQTKTGKNITSLAEVIICQLPDFGRQAFVVARPQPWNHLPVTTRVTSTNTPDCFK